MKKADKTPAVSPALAKALRAEQTPEAVGRRVRLVRKYVGLNQEKFVEPAGIRQPVYSNYEKGKHMLAPEVALALCSYPPYQSKTGLTMDFLYRGDTQLLRQKFAEWLSDKL